jgi:hypothetical protein
MAADGHDRSFKSGGIEGKKFAQFGHIAGRSRDRAKQEIFRATSLIAHCTRSPQCNIESHASASIQLESTHLENRM